MAPPSLHLKNQIGECFRSGLFVKAAFRQIEGGPWLHLPGVIPGGEPGLRFSSMHCPTPASTTNQTVVSKKDALADVSRCPRLV